MIMRAASLVAALSAFAATSLQAQSMGHDLPSGFRSVAGVKLDSDSAASILARLGATVERDFGAGNGTSSILCYVATQGHAAVLLELMMGRGEPGDSRGQTLDVIRWRTDAPAAARRGCAALKESSRLATPAGLRLGMDDAAIRYLLGAPTRTNADSVIYEFQAKEYMRPGTPEYETWNTPEYRESCFNAGPPFANAYGRIIILFRDRRASEIRIERHDQSVC